jgi:hypothetical protein
LPSKTILVVKGLPIINGILEVAGFGDNSGCDKSTPWGIRRRDIMLY